MSSVLQGLGSATDLLTEIAVEAPEAVFGGFLHVLAQAEHQSLQQLQWRLEEISSTAQVRGWVRRMMASLKADPVLAPQALAVGLLTARKVVALEQPQIELVWTGPQSTDSVLRRTDQVLLSLIESAKTELLIVSFAVYQESRWLQSIRDALERDVSVTFVVETASSGKIDFQGLSHLDQHLLDDCRILTWDASRRPVNAKGQTGALHAKCAIADRATAFISSANLTPHALTLNIEIGLLVTGDQLPERIARIFEGLETRGDLVPMQISSSAAVPWKSTSDH